MLQLILVHGSQLLKDNSHISSIELGSISCRSEFALRKCHTRLVCLDRSQTRLDRSQFTFKFFTFRDHFSLRSISVHIQVFHVQRLLLTQINLSSQSSVHIQIAFNLDLTHFCERPHKVGKLTRPLEIQTIFPTSENLHTHEYRIVVDEMFFKYRILVDTLRISFSAHETMVTNRC